MGTAQGLLCIGRRMCRAPHQVDLHPASRVVQVTRSHQAVAAVVAGPGPHLDELGVGCQCLGQLGNGQAGTFHQHMGRHLSEGCLFGRP